MEYLVYWAFSGVAFCTIGELVRAAKLKRDHLGDTDWTEILVIGSVFGPLIFLFLVKAIWFDK